MAKNVISFRLSNETLKELELIQEILKLDNTTEAVIQSIHNQAQTLKPHTWAEVKEQTTVIWSQDFEHQEPVGYLEIPTQIYEAFPDYLKYQLDKKEADPGIVFILTLLTHEKLKLEAGFQVNEEYQAFPWENFPAEDSLTTER